MEPSPCDDQIRRKVGGLVMLSLCCVAISTEDCQPQIQFVSTRSELISSVTQKVAIMSQGIIVLYTTSAY